MQDFKKLEVWVMGKDIALIVYQITSRFPKHEIFGITNQLRRASVSISSNIAEGCGRSSQADFARFLQIAVGSLTEVESLLHICLALEYVSQENFTKTILKIDLLRKKLITFRKKVLKIP